MSHARHTLATAFFAASVLLTSHAFGQSAPSAQIDAKIRATLGENLKDFPKIDRVLATPISGVYEVQYGTDVFYTNADGSLILQGSLIRSSDKHNLTQDSVSKLTALDFSSLPEKDAIKTVRGKGERKIAVFADPNCGYCKRFEADLKRLDNVTILTFLYPVLGQDSRNKARAIWCAKDREQVWESWMLAGTAIPEAPATCDASAVERNVEFGRAKRITGTPTTYFADGRRVPGAMPGDQLVRQLDQAGKPNGG